MPLKMVHFLIISSQTIRLFAKLVWMKIGLMGKQLGVRKAIVKVNRTPLKLIADHYL